MKQHECAGSKFCTECKEEKNLTEFYTKWNRPKTKRRYFAKCKDCVNTKNREAYSTNEKSRENKLAKQKILRSTPEYKEHKKEYTEKYKEANREKISDQKKEYRSRPEVAAREKLRTDAYYADRKEAIQAKRKKRLIDNPELREVRNEMNRGYYAVSDKTYYTEKSERRRARVGERTPKWYNKKEVLKIRREVKRLTEETGVKHHLDHIIPLNGEKVSGLHWHGNMQILTATENLQKGNKLE